MDILSFFLTPISCKAELIFRTKSFVSFQERCSQLLFILKPNSGLFSYNSEFLKKICGKLLIN